MSLFEIMKSEKNENKDDKTEEAISDALKLAEEQKSETVGNIIYAAVGIFFFVLVLITVYMRGVSMFIPSVMLYFGILAVFMIYGFMKKETDEHMKTIYRGCLIFAVSVTIIGGIWVLPQFVIEKYGDILLLAASVFIFINIIKSFVNIVQNRDKRSKKSFVGVLIMTAVCIVIYVFTIGNQIKEIGSSAENERLNVAKRYAQQLVLNKCDIEPENITGTDITYANPVGDLPERFVIVFSYVEKCNVENGDYDLADQKMYACEIEVNGNFDIIVLDEGADLAKKYVSTVIIEN